MIPLVVVRILQESLIARKDRPPSPFERNRTRILQESLIAGKDRPPFERNRTREK